MAAGAVGAFGTPGLTGAVDARLGCLLDVLGRRSSEPARERAMAGCTGAWLLVAFRVMSERSTALCAALPRIVPWPVGDGNCVSLKSVEAVSRLLCRSSKLTEGRKSNEVAGSVTSPGRPFLPPKENREWLFEDEALSIGAASRVGREMEPTLVGLELRDLLDCKNKTQG
jgi:hypothetical protein